MTLYIAVNTRRAPIYYFNLCAYLLDVYHVTYLLDVKCKQNVQRKVDAEEISISFYGMYHVT